MINENLLTALGVISTIMLTLSTVLGVFIVVFIKLLRDDIKIYLNNYTYNKKNEMSQIEGDNKIGSYKKEDPIIFKDNGNREDEYIKSCKEELKYPENFDSEFRESEKIEDFIKEKSISTDNIPHAFTIERNLTKEDNQEPEYIDDSNAPFIENTVTVHEINPLSKEDFKKLSYDEMKEYTASIIKDKYGTVENTPDKVKEALLSLHKFCKENNDNIIEENKNVTVIKDNNTGRFKFDFETPVEKMYMDLQRNEQNHYML